MVTTLDTLWRKIGTRLSLTGGTMLGRLFLAQDPTAALEAVTKQYCDANSGGSPAAVSLARTFMLMGA